ncbi:class I adenylate-forming enzyme family protein [Tuberibacillus sp. Marseille-P3662]|uniref:class I adenylate-forming enzyme family protein n=1 Tax=Tuberibacillus sp. Marseille-P3662 TaxID=1965358 RepID=UPI0020CB11C5|nr:AMP-binding protein [Tuberibacillus sp. Marseille-P3662]
MTTIHGILERHARKYPVKEAWITPTARLSYPDMNRTVNQMARWLQNKGVSRYDRIAIQSNNNEHFFYAYFALMKLGAIPMPLNVKLTSNELIPLLNNTKASGVLFESAYKPVIDEVTAQNLIPYCFSIEDATKLARGFSTDNLELAISSKDIAEIMFTSGTTGVPKGVLFTHEQLTAVATAIAIEFNLSADDRSLTLMPLSHSAPLNDFFLAPFYCGASHVIGDYTPQAFLQAIHKEQTTTTFAAPIAYLLAAKHPHLQSYDLSSMRVFAYGGSPMPLASYQYVSQAFRNNNFYQVYGLTEAGPNGCLLRPEEHHTKPGSIGKTPVVNVEMKIVTESGIETTPGQYGEIILKGDSLMVGYDNNAQATLETIQDGWLYTGDIAYRDADGYIYIVDRKKDIIIPGGVNVYPREVENILTKHPGVEQVCVVGVADKEWGETVKAVVVPKEGAEPTQEALKEYVSEHLADYKQPRIYRFVKALPHNASGKLLKQKIKEM